MAGKDTDIPGMDTVHITENGTVVGGARNAFVLASPVRKSIKRNIPLDETELEENITITKDSIKDAMGLISKDTVFGGLLEYLDIEDKGGSALIKTVDKKKDVRFKASKYRRKYPDYKSVVKRILNTKVKKRVIINRARLQLLLETLQKVCPDVSGESPVYMEFTEKDELILRSFNVKNGQRALGVMFNYLYRENDWLDENVWEENLKGGSDE